MATIPTPTAPSISVVIPFYNEAENLPILICELHASLEPTGQSYEVLLVDDGSTDGSLEALQALASLDRRLRVLTLGRNRGQSTALVTGFRHARGETIVTLDSDLQNDPADIPSLLEALKDCDLVSGVRQQRQDTWVRRVSSRVANRVRSRLLHDGVSDVGCSLKAYRAELLHRIPTFEGMHRFLPALAQIEGARVREIAVHHRPRRFGVAKYNIRNRLWRGLRDLVAVRWMQGRWISHRLDQEVREWTKPPSG